MSWQRNRLALREIDLLDSSECRLKSLGLIEPERHEPLNAYLKHAFLSKVPLWTRAKLCAAAYGHMDFIDVNRDRVRRYFQDPFIEPAG